MSTVTIPIIYNGIALVSQQNNSFEIDIPYTMSTGVSAPTLPTQDSNHPPVVVYELNSQGGMSIFPTTATLSITGVATFSSSDGSNYFEISLQANNLQTMTAAIVFTITLDLGVTPFTGGSLELTYGMVQNSPTTQNYPFQIFTATPSFLSSLTLGEIISNINFPAAAAILPPSGVAPIMPLPTPTVTPFDTTVSIPVTVPPPTPPNQNYLGVIFVVKMVFGGILTPGSP